MKQLRGSHSADAIVDGLRRRRAEVCVPSSLRPLSVLDSPRARPLPRSPEGTAIDRRFVHNGQPHRSRARGACAARPRAIARSATKAAGGEAKAGGATSA